MHRCYHPQADWSTPLQQVEGEEARHALRVMRLRVGDEMEIFDGRGQAAVARITAVNGSLSMNLCCERLLPPLPRVADITLALAIPKGSNMDLIVQKAVELGASRIVPLITERTIVRLTTGEVEAKTKKWARTALEACKQCGVNILPTVEIPQGYPLFLQRNDLPSLRLQCAITESARSLRGVLESARAEGCRGATLLIGPEGDFSLSEYAAGQAAGYVPVSLGPIILRVETAVFMALSAARYALD